jgi:uncharacterized membrane protein
MSAESISAELLDYLNDELSTDRREAVEEMLRKDPEKARELDDYRQAQKAFKKLRLKAPSVDFNEKVLKRITTKIEELRARGSQRFRTSRERVDDAREGLSTAEIKKRSRKAAKFSLLAMVLLAIPLLCAIIGLFVHMRDSAAKKNKTMIEKKTPIKEKRRTAKRTALRVLEGGLICGMDSLADGSIRVLTDGGAGGERRCFFIYDETEWKGFMKLGWDMRGTKRFSSWEDTRARAIIVKVAGGMAQLPKDLRKFLPLSSGPAVLLRGIKGHSEIWLENELEEHLLPEVVINLKPPAQQ